jgi:DNA-binding MarR family transcriptional regulator
VRASAADSSVAVSTWLRLLKAHGLILREARRRVPGGLTLPQFDVMAQLSREPDGMTPGRLTRELLVTAGNLTGIVFRLVQMGLVERLPVPGDRRAVRVRLTPRGRALMARAIPRHRRELRALMRGMPEARLVRLRDLLGQLGQTLEADAAAKPRSANAR